MKSSMTFTKTHPWISFEANLRGVSVTVWTMLGECKSKCDHITRVPLQPRTAMALQTLYLAKGAWATTAIEGNTLSEEEVRQHFEGHLKLLPSREYLALEVDNIRDACTFIFNEAVEGKLLPLSPERIKKLNEMVLKNLSREDGVEPGVIRKDSRGVGPYKAPPADECEFLLDKLCAWLNGKGFVSTPGLEKVYAILKAIIAHLYLAWIHPFGNGNGRTARLIEFEILVSSGIPAPAAHLLSNHYNLTRSEYYRQLDIASKSGGDITQFITYAVQGLRDGLVTQLEYIHEQQLNIIWQNYIYEQFSNDNTDAGKRRRNLVLDLSSHDSPVPLSKLNEISPRIAVAYAQLDPKTLSRDLSLVVDMQLVIKETVGYRARKELILAFLPPKANPTLHKEND